MLQRRAWKIGVLVVGFVEKGAIDGIWAGFAGLKNRSSRASIQAIIDLKMWECSSRDVRMKDLGTIRTRITNG